MNQELRTALDNLRKAVEDKGPQPKYHDAVFFETEKRWPALIHAVKDVLNADTS